MAQQNNANRRNTQETDTSQSPSQLAKRLLIVAFVVTVVSVQIVIAAIFIPSARSAEKANGVLPEPVQDPSIESLIRLNETTPTVEVDLGSFEVTSYQPSSDVTLRVEFQLCGVISEENLSEFKRVYQRRKNRLREQVQIVIRSADPNDLRDSGLGLIKRRLQSKVNCTLGKRLLDGVVIPHISTVEI